MTVQKVGRRQDGTWAWHGCAGPSFSHLPLTLCPFAHLVTINLLAFSLLPLLSSACLVVCSAPTSLDFIVPSISLTAWGSERLSASDLLPQTPICRLVCVCPTGPLLLTYATVPSVPSLANLGSVGQILTHSLTKTLHFLTILSLCCLLGCRPLLDSHVTGHQGALQELHRVFWFTVTLFVVTAVSLVHAFQNSSCFCFHFPSAHDLLPTSQSYQRPWQGLSHLCHYVPKLKTPPLCPCLPTPAHACLVVHSAFLTGLLGEVSPQGVSSLLCPLSSCPLPPASKPVNLRTFWFSFLGCYCSFLVIFVVLQMSIF